MLPPNGARVLARISKMPVQNSITKIYALPDLTTQLLQILTPTTFSSLLCQKGDLHFSLALEDGLLGKYLFITSKKSKLKIFQRNLCLSKKDRLKLPVQKTGWTGWTGPGYFYDLTNHKCVTVLRAKVSLRTVGGQGI